MRKLLFLPILLMMLGCSSEKRYYAIIHVSPGHPEYFQSYIERVEIKAENDSMACVRALWHFYNSLEILYDEYKELSVNNDSVVFDPFYLGMDLFDEENNPVPLKSKYRKSVVNDIPDELKREIELHKKDHVVIWEWEQDWMWR